MLYVDLYPVKPKGINNKTNKVDMEYTMIITDDASRFRTTICLAKKSDASSVLEQWTKQFKEHTSYYPTEWRFDNGTEFIRFTRYARGKSMIVNPSSPYAHEQNGVSEFSGHYVIQIARTMYIDAEAPKEL